MNNSECRQIKKIQQKNSESSENITKIQIVENLFKKIRKPRKFPEKSECSEIKGGKLNSESLEN